MESKKLVAIMGESGAGKSSFINSILGQELATVGGDTFSCTETIEKYSYTWKDEVTIALVDTPGFNHYGKNGNEGRGDSEILNMVTQFLNESDNQPKVFAGIVFLHAVNLPSTLTVKPDKMMKTFAKLCGGTENVVVVTTRWDEASDAAEGEDGERSLQESDGFLKCLHDANVPFRRIGHFEEGHTPEDGQYLSPLTIVEQLLGLRPDKDETVSPPEQHLSGCMEQIRKTPEDLQSATDNAKSERGEMNDDLKRRLDNWESLLGKFCDQWKPWENREKILDGQEKLGSQVVELKQALEINQKERDEIAAGRQSLREHERRVLELQADKLALSEELDKVKSALAEKTAQAEIMKMESSSIYVSGLRAQLGEMKSERDTVEASKLETERELESTREMLKEAKEGLETRAQESARLTEQVQAQATEIKIQSQRVTSLEAELEKEKERAQRAASLEMELGAEKRKSEEQGRGSAHLRKQLEDGTQRIVSLETELEKGKQRLEEMAQELAKQAKDRGSENEAHLRRASVLEMELKESKKKSEAQAQELTRLRREVQDKTTSSRRSANRITSLELELEKWKKKSEEQAQETIQLKGQIQNKITQGELHAQQIASLETDLEGWKQNSDLQTQESNSLKAEVQDLLAQCGTLTKTIGSLEQELRSYQNSPPQAHQPQSASPPPQSPFGRVNSFRTGTTLNPQRAASPVNQSTRFSGFSVSQSTPPSSPPNFPSYSSPLVQPSMGPNFSSPYPAFTTNNAPTGNFNQPPVEPGFDPTLLQRNNQPANWNANFNYPSESPNFHNGYGTNSTGYPSSQGDFQQGGNTYGNWYTSN